MLIPILNFFALLELQTIRLVVYNFFLLFFQTLAKLVCARHKPRQQTVLPMEFVHEVYLFTPIQDIRMLGGKLGKSLQFAFNITVNFSLLPY